MKLLNIFVVKHCAPPPLGVNQIVEHEGTHYGSTSRYQCQSGYLTANLEHLVQTLTCEENQLWNPTETEYCQGEKTCGYA